MRWRSRLADLHAFPKRDAAFDVGGGLFGLGVVPGSVWVHVAIDIDGVITGLTLPGATGLVVAKADVLTLDRSLREIVVPLDHDGIVAFSNDGVLPDGFHTQTPW